MLTNVGFAATRPTSGRSRPPLQALPRTPTSPPSSRKFIAPCRRLGTSSIPFGPPCSNRAKDAEPSIPIATRNSHRPGPLRGFLPRGLSDACPQAPRHAHSHVNKGRHRITLNELGNPELGAGSAPQQPSPTSVADPSLPFDSEKSNGRSGREATRRSELPGRSAIRGAHQRNGTLLSGLGPLCIPKKDAQSAHRYARATTDQDRYRLLNLFLLRTHRVDLFRKI